MFTVYFPNILGIMYPLTFFLGFHIFPTKILYFFHLPEPSYTGILIVYLFVIQYQIFDKFKLQFRWTDKPTNVICIAILLHTCTISCSTFSFKTYCPHDFQGFIHFLQANSTTVPEGMLKCFLLHLFQVMCLSTYYLGIMTFNKPQTNES